MGFHRRTICKYLEVNINEVINLEIIGTGIQGLYVINPNKNMNKEEIVLETYNSSEFDKFGLTMKFVQENESVSMKNVLRGLHIQKKHPQGKLVRVANGEIIDVAVDLRKGSSTYGCWRGIELSSDNNKQFYIPEGFAHGFYVRSETAKVIFKVSNYWYPDDEIYIPWDDPSLNIDWGIPDGLIPVIL